MTNTRTWRRVVEVIRRLTRRDRDTPAGLDPLGGPIPDRDLPPLDVDDPHTPR